MTPTGQQLADWLTFAASRSDGVPAAGVVAMIEQEAVAAERMRLRPDAAVARTALATALDEIFDPEAAYPERIIDAVINVFLREYAALLEPGDG